MLQWIAFWTVAKSEIKRIIRIWVQTLFPPLITTALYFIIFGGVIGHRIGAMNGHSYAAFIAPGLIMMSMITASFSNTVGSFYINKYNNSIQEMLVSPTNNATILLGYMTGGVLRGLIVGAIVTCVALCFTHFNVHSWWAIFFSALFATSLFSLVGIINAIFAKSFNSISIVPTFILTPLTYIGGVFYSISLLPPFWRHVSMANPIVYIIDAFRYGFLGQQGHGIVIETSMMLLFVVLFFGLALYLLRCGIGLKN